MSNYTKSTNFATKDALASGNPLKIVKGTEIDTEFNNIATAVNSKVDSYNPTITGQASFADGSVTAPSITNDGDSNTGIFFPAADTIAFAEGGVESMRIDSSGNVGIGTNSPVSGRLNVQAGTSLTGNSIFCSNIDGTYNPYIQIQHNGTNGTKLFVSSTAGGTAGNLTLDPAAATIFQSAGTEFARIDTSGNLLVGATSAVGRFTANRASGNWVASFQGANAAAAVLIGNQSGTTTYEAIVFTHSGFGTQTGNITVTSSGTTTYNSSSDYRLKENVQPMTGALAKVAALKPCTYKWKSDGSVGEGFIAHELQEVCPDAVTGEKDAVDADGNPKYQGIDTSLLVATLTAAIQEQQTIIQSLTARIEVLEGK